MQSAPGSHLKMASVWPLPQNVWKMEVAKKASDLHFYGASCLLLEGKIKPVWNVVKIVLRSFASCDPNVSSYSYFLFPISYFLFPISY